MGSFLYSLQTTLAPYFSTMSAPPSSPEASTRLESYGDQIVSLIEEAETVFTGVEGKRAGLRLSALENITTMQLPALVNPLRELTGYLTEKSI